MKLVEDVVCLRCGCLCDDIVLVQDDRRTHQARNACDLGRVWFLDGQDEPEAPEALIEGQPVPIGEALDRAVALLSTARTPRIAGLASTTMEAQAAAVALAERLGARIEWAEPASEARIRAVQRVGEVTATLGEVKDRADVVVYWQADPIISHPRHWDRYAVEPHGRFVPRGRADRVVLVADTVRTATAGRADVYLPLDADRSFETLWMLRGIIKGVVNDRGPLAAFAARLRSARYGAFFLGSVAHAPTVEAALSLVRDLNMIDNRRFVFLDMGGPDNPAGASYVVTRRLGTPLMKPFGEPDIELIVGEAPEESVVPRIRLGPSATRAVGAAVAIASAPTGLETSGTVLRCDGVSLPLRPTRPRRRPWDVDLLIELLKRLDSPNS